jgi:hypothetical protein
LLLFAGVSGELTEINGAPSGLRSPLAMSWWEFPMERIQITQHTSLGALWFAGWLFSIGYLKLEFWMGLLGLFVWPYFLGSHFTPA